MSHTDCTKVPYDTMSEAREALDSFEIDEDHKRKPIRAYRCDIEGCGKYHVTSQGKTEKTKKNTNRKDQKKLNWNKPDINAVIYSAEERKKKQNEKGKNPKSKKRLDKRKR